MYDIIHKSTYNVNGQLVSYIKSDKAGYGLTEVVHTYHPNGMVASSTETDLGYRYFWFCQNRNLPFGGLNIQKVLNGEANEVLTYAV